MAENEDSHYEQGRTDARGYYKSQALTSLTEFVTAEDAMKLYWPPVEESMMMVSMPLPKPRQKWIAGFKKEQIAIRAEHLVCCKCCGQKLPELAK